MAALAGLSVLLEQAPFEAATRLRGLPAKHRAQIALGRLHRANIKADHMLAIHLAVLAFNEGGSGSHRTTEFRLVQTAKAVHRLASGTHRVWQRQDQYGRVGKLELHNTLEAQGAYCGYSENLSPGNANEGAEKYLADILALKLKRYGGHPVLDSSPTR